LANVDPGLTLTAASLALALFMLLVLNMARLVGRPMRRAGKRALHHDAD
jgi:hypothetical protein